MRWQKNNIAYFLKRTKQSHLFVLKKFNLNSHMKPIFHRKISFILWISLIIWGLLTWCWSTNTWNEQLEDNKKTVETVAVEEVETVTTIHALWDSLTAWYQLPIGESYPSQLQVLLQNKNYNTKTVNGWISGDTSEWLNRRIDRQLEWAKEDDIAILVIWANDGLRWLPIPQMKENIKQITTTILEKNLFLIIWGMQIPLNNAPEYRTDFQQVYIDLCRELSENQRVWCIEFFLEWVALNPALNLADGIHPNKQGYAIIAEAVLPYVENFLK